MFKSSTQNTGDSRYGGEEYNECGYECPQVIVKKDACCGYYVVPVHHIVTNEKQVEVKKVV